MGMIHLKMPTAGPRRVQPPCGEAPKPPKSRGWLIKRLNHFENELVTPSLEFQSVMRKAAVFLPRFMYMYALSGSKVHTAREEQEVENVILSILSRFWSRAMHDAQGPLPV